MTKNTRIGEEDAKRLWKLYGDFLEYYLSKGYLQKDLAKTIKRSESYITQLKDLIENNKCPSIIMLRTLETGFGVVGMPKDYFGFANASLTPEQNIKLVNHLLKEKENFIIKIKCREV